MLEVIAYLALGVGAAVAAVVVGHSYWAWRKSRGGPLTSAERDVSKLT